MKKLFKEYLSLTSPEKLKRIRYLRKKYIKGDRSVMFLNNDNTCYYDFEKYCIRELNGDVILYISEKRSNKEKELILKAVDPYFYDKPGLINKNITDLDYFYITPSDLYPFDSKKNIDFVSEILEEIKRNRV